ncbi:MAG: ABC transporter ATP-binding protein [Atribacterota bacterium]
MVHGLQVSFRVSSGLLRIVQEVSFQIERGESVGILGESGCGKSVVLLALLRLLPRNAVVSGTVLFDRRDLFTLSEQEMNTVRGFWIGFVPQSPGTSLNPLMKIRTHLWESGRTLLPKLKQERVRTFLERLGFSYPDQVLFLYPHQLSGGMQQRILVAMGSMTVPLLVLADEPTKGLDAALRMRIVETFQTMMTATKSALLIVSHDYLVLRKLVRRVMVMYAGEIVEIGESELVFSRPLHPYTIALFRSLPENGMIPIPGGSFSFTHRPLGCAFHPRCFQSRPDCAVVHPELLEIVANRWVRCPYVVV